MERTVLQITLRLRWWVHPYMWLLRVFVWTVTPFLDEDDERLECFIVRQAEFIGEHGFILRDQSGRRS